MIRSAAVAKVRQGLSFRTSSANLNSVIVEALQNVQRDLERGKTLPRFLVQEDASLTITANVAYIAHPTGFLREVEDERPWLDASGDDAAIELQKADFNQAKTLWLGSEVTTPRVYAMRKARMWLFPTPTEAGTITWSYYKAADLLDEDADENVWLLNAPDLMVAQAGLLVAADLNDKEALAKFQALAAQYQKTELFKIADDETSGGYVIMGGNN